MRKFYWFFIAGLLLYSLAIGVYLFHASSSLPAEFQGGPSDPATFMTAEQMEHSLNYSRIKNLVYFIGGPLEWGIYLLILALGLAAKYRDWVQGVKGSFFQIALFVILLTLTTAVLLFPLDYYMFQLRHAYGLSTEPFVSWITDKLKALALSVIMTSPMVWLFYRLMRKSRQRWWFWSWLLSIPIVLFLMYIQPVVLDPIFHQFSPLQDQQLKRDILQLAETAHIPAEQVYQVDMSKKTTALNAYVNGIGPNTRIVLWDTTLQKLKKDEILFIMAHELGHYVLKHMMWLFIGSILMILAALYALHHILRWVTGRFGDYWGIRGPEDVASFPLVLLILSVLSFFSMPIQNGVSRQYEHAADRYAMEMMQDPDAAVRAFQRLAVEGLSEVNPPPLVKIFLYSHPTLHERIIFVQEYERRP